MATLASRGWSQLLIPILWHPLADKYDARGEMDFPSACQRLSSLANARAVRNRLEPLLTVTIKSAVTIYSPRIPYLIPEIFTSPCYLSNKDGRIPKEINPGATGSVFECETALVCTLPS